MQFGRAYNKAIRDNEEFFTFEGNVLYTKYAYYICVNLINEGIIKGDMHKNIVKFA